MAVSYPTASLTPVLKKPRQRHAGGAFLCASVGASLLAKNVNDNAFTMNKRIALRFFASKLAPTGLLRSSKRCLKSSLAAW